LVSLIVHNPPFWAIDPAWVASPSPISSPRREAVYGGGFAATRLRAMELTTILNRCHHFRGFVYEHARFSTDKKSIEVVLRPRKGSAAVCSRCHLPAPGYDQLAERRFEFIPLWGFFVFLLYAMRRVDCRRCGGGHRGSPLGRRQTHADQSVYAFPSPLGAPTFVERNRRVRRIAILSRILYDAGP
jgi:hypothetical protein